MADDRMSPVAEGAAGAQQVYDRLWTQALHSLSAGGVRTDPNLPDRRADRRSGLTLVIRPAPDLVSRFGPVMDALRALEPEQYYYQPVELHVTLLTLVSASEAFDLAAAPLAAYDQVLQPIFAGAHPFRLRFAGLTASPECVLLQGYSEDDYLNDLRSEIRLGLQQAGLAAGLDLRYKISTAHVTCMRFCAQTHDPARLAAALLTWRDHPFGTMEVGQVDLVVNDWYMAADRVRVLARYSLR